MPIILLDNHRKFRNLLISSWQNRTYTSTASRAGAWCRSGTSSQQSRILIFYLFTTQFLNVYRPFLQNDGNTHIAVVHWYRTKVPQHNYKLVLDASLIQKSHYIGKTEPSSFFYYVFSMLHGYGYDTCIRYDTEYGDAVIFNMIRISTIQYVSDTSTGPYMKYRGNTVFF